MLIENSFIGSILIKDEEQTPNSMPNFTRITSVLKVVVDSHLTGFSHDSFESTTRVSEAQDRRIAKNSKKSIIQYKQKALVLKNSTFLLSFMLIAFSIIYPFARTRFTSRDSFYSLATQFLINHADALVVNAEQLFSKYEMTSYFLAHLYNDPTIISCSPERMVEYTTYVKTLLNNLSPKPSRLFTVQFDEPQRYCQFEFTPGNNSNFSFYYVFQVDNNLVVKRYNDSIDYSNWDYENTGELIKVVTKEEFNFSNTFEPTSNVTYWSDKFSIFNDSMDTLQMSANTPVRSTDEVLKIISSISIPTQKMAEILIDSNNKVELCHFALLKINGGVIINDELGVIYPKVVTALRPIFPKLNEIDSPLWKQVAKELPNFKYNTTYKIVVNESEFLVIKRCVAPRNKNHTHDLITVLNYDPLLEAPLADVSATFIVTLVATGLIFILARLFLKRNSETRERKLAKQKEHSLNTTGINLLSMNNGVITDSIEKLRNLQLKLPDDVILNKTLDNVVLNLSEQRYSHMIVTKEHGCNYCEHLASHKRSIVQTPLQNAFSTWKITANKLTLRNLPDFPNFNFEDYQNDPINMLIRLMSTIILKENLLFEQFDPDFLTQFFIIFASKCCDDPIHTAHVIFTLYSLIATQFKFWIRPFDLFILLFTAFVQDVNYINAIKAINEDQTDVDDTGLITNVIHSNEVFKDESSFTLQKIRLIFDFFHEIMPLNREDPLCIHFENTVTILLKSQQAKRQFDLLGEVRNRIQSSEFSTTTSMGDCNLFMKSILKFADYIDYMSSEDIMLKALTYRNAKFLTPEERADTKFVAKYHYEIASKLVTPWLAVFINFASLTILSAHLDHTINYWNMLIERE